ncbi:MAG: hypothetical protein HYW88_02115 [Candidatus Sungbacteria bacterium]|nr:hypothetical protein [Candidatus Sungbacteria bacterium]
MGGERTKYIVLSYWQTAEGEKLVNTLARYHEIRLVGSFYPTADTDLAQRGIVDYINNPIDWKTLFQLKKAGPFVEIYEIVHI